LKGGVVTGTFAVLALTFAFSSIAFAQTGSDPNLSGNWVDKSDAAKKIALTEKGDTIKVHETDGDKVIADYTCNLSGKQCDIKEDGHSAKVMMYYNGSKLVEITERGSDVTKRRFSLSQDGNTMTMELIPVSPEGNNTTRAYEKQNAQIAKTGS
jgi:hypothetical protein